MAERRILSCWNGGAVGAEQELEKLSIIPETMELNQADFQKLATGLTV